MLSVSSRLHQVMRMGAGPSLDEHFTCYITEPDDLNGCAFHIQALVVARAQRMQYTNCARLSNIEHHVLSRKLDNMTNWILFS